MDVRPRPRTVPTPAYPEELQSQAVSGWVDFAFTLGADGRVEPASLAVVYASHPAFVRPATEALLAATFAPAQKDGQAVRMRMQQRIRFSVRGR